MRSFCSFDVLPLVEFVLQDGISDDEAQKLIDSAPGIGGGGGAGRGGAARDADGWRENDHGGHQVMSLGGDEDGEGGHAGATDKFSAQLMSGDMLKISGPVEVDRDILASIESTEVFVVKWARVMSGHGAAQDGQGGKAKAKQAAAGAIKHRYYKNVVPETPIVLCPQCNHFFHEVSRCTAI